MEVVRIPQSRRVQELRVLVEVRFIVVCPVVARMLTTFTRESHTAVVDVIFHVVRVVVEAAERVAARASAYSECEHTIAGCSAQQ